MERRGRTAAASCGRAVVLAAAALLTGCTMCPDPYDYSGPVPNGSSPQNDFRARSGGILPLGASPRPWPPIVKHEAAKGFDVVVAAAQRVTGSRKPAPRRGEPTLAEADGDAGGEPAVTIEPTSVLVSAEEAEPTAAEPASAPGEVVNPPAMIEVPAPLAESEPAGELTLPVVDEAPSPNVESPPAVESPAPASDGPPPAVEAPRLAETPGWRPRQAR